MSTVKNQIESIFKVWDKLELIIEEDNERSDYICRIEDITDDKLVITKPEYRGGSILLREAIPLRVLVVKQDAVYQFTAKISRRGEAPDMKYYLDLPSLLERFQRRNFVRVDDFTTGTISKVERGMSAVRSSWYPYRSENISGSGILIKTPKKINCDELFLINHDLLKLVGIKIPVLSICRRDFAIKKQFYYGLEFITDNRIPAFFENNNWQYLPKTVFGFNLSAQEELSSFIFKKQVKLRKEGLI